MYVICGICLDVLGPADVIFGTPCGHVNHGKCMSDWLSRSKSCPQCRKAINDGDVRRMFLIFSENNELEILQAKLLQRDHQIEEASAKIMLLETLQDELIDKNKRHIADLERHRQLQEEFYRMRILPVHSMDFFLMLKLESMSRDLSTEAENSVPKKTKTATVKRTKKKTEHPRVPLSTVDQNTNKTRCPYNLRPR